MPPLSGLFPPLQRRMTAKERLSTASPPPSSTRLLWTSCTSASSPMSPWARRSASTMGPTASRTAITMSSAASSNVWAWWRWMLRRTEFWVSIQNFLACSFFYLMGQLLEHMVWHPCYSRIIWFLLPVPVWLCPPFSWTPVTINQSAAIPLTLSSLCRLCMILINRFLQVYRSTESPKSLTLKLQLKRLSPVSPTRSSRPSSGLWSWQSRGTSACLMILMTSSLTLRWSQLFLSWGAKALAMSFVGGALIWLEPWAWLVLRLSALVNND